MKTTSRGPCHVNAVHMGEVKIDALTSEIRLEGKAILLNSPSGNRLGFHQRTSWSPRTHEKLMALLESMEEDVLVSLFGEGAASESPAQPASMDGVPGL